MVSWSTIQSLVIFFGPIIYPRLRAFYYTIQHPPHPPRPLPHTPRILLNILFASCIISLPSTFPIFQPENILKATNSRILQTSTDVIFNRLYNIRPPTPSDTLLKSRFTSRDGRLLYSLYGPGPLTSCTWCRIDTPETFFLYALPSILFPHLIHVAVIGIVTSARFLGGNNKAGSIWRTQATIAGLILAAGEVWYIFTYSHTQNISARTASESVYPYWQLLTFRGLSIALVDAALGYAIYLTGTGRWGALLLTTPSESLEEIASKLENALAGVNSSVCLKQAIMRDQELRSETVRFWEAEDLAGREIAQVEEVRLARKTVERRGEWARIKGEAKKRARMVTRGLFVKRPPPQPMGDDEDDEENDQGSENYVKQEEVEEEEEQAQRMRRGGGSGYFGDEGGDVITSQEDEELEVEGMQQYHSSEQSAASSL